MIFAADAAMPPSAALLLMLSAASIYASRFFCWIVDFAERLRCRFRCRHAAIFLLFDFLPITRRRLLPLRCHFRALFSLHALYAAIYAHDTRWARAMLDAAPCARFACFRLPPTFSMLDADAGYFADDMFFAFADISLMPCFSALILAMMPLLSLRYFHFDSSSLRFSVIFAADAMLIAWFSRFDMLSDDFFSSLILEAFMPFLQLSMISPFIFAYASHALFRCRAAVWYRFRWLFSLIDGHAADAASRRCFDFRWLRFRWFRYAPVSFFLPLFMLMLIIYFSLCRFLLRFTPLSFLLIFRFIAAFIAAISSMFSMMLIFRFHFCHEMLMSLRFSCRAPIAVISSFCSLSPYAAAAAALFIFSLIAFYYFIYFAPLPRCWLFSLMLFSYDAMLLFSDAFDFRRYFRHFHYFFFRNSYDVSTFSFRAAFAFISLRDDAAAIIFLDISASRHWLFSAPLFAYDAMPRLPLICLPFSLFYAFSFIFFCFVRRCRYWLLIFALLSPLLMLRFSCRFLWWLIAAFAFASAFDYAFFFFFLPISRCRCHSISGWFSFISFFIYFRLLFHWCLHFDDIDASLSCHFSAMLIQAFRWLFFFFIFSICLMPPFRYALLYFRHIIWFLPFYAIQCHYYFDFFFFSMLIIFMLSSSFSFSPLDFIFRAMPLIVDFFHFRWFSPCRRFRLSMFWFFDFRFFFIFRCFSIFSISLSLIFIIFIIFMLLSLWYCFADAGWLAAAAAFLPLFLHADDTRHYYFRRRWCFCHFFLLIFFIFAAAAMTLLLMPLLSLFHAGLRRVIFDVAVIFIIIDFSFLHWFSLRFRCFRRFLLPFITLRFDHCWWGCNISAPFLLFARSAMLRCRASAWWYTECRLMRGVPARSDAAALRRCLLICRWWRAAYARCCRFATCRCLLRLLPLLLMHAMMMIDAIYFRRCWCWWCHARHFIFDACCFLRAVGVSMHADIIDYFSWAMIFLIFAITLRCLSSMLPLISLLHFADYFIFSLFSAEIILMPFAFFAIIFIIDIYMPLLLYIIIFIIFFFIFRWLPLIWCW